MNYELSDNELAARPFARGGTSINVQKASIQCYLCSKRAHFLQFLQIFYNFLHFFLFASAFDANFSRFHTRICCEIRRFTLPVLPNRYNLTPPVFTILDSSGPKLPPAKKHWSYRLTSSIIPETDRLFRSYL
jgi:hypothetical protein